MMRICGTQWLACLNGGCCGWLPPVALSVLAVLADGREPAVETARLQWPSTARIADFSIHADFPLRRYDQLFRGLSTLRSDVVEYLSLEDEHEPIDIYLFSSPRGYRAYMARYFPEISPRRAMFVKANSPGNVFAYISPELDVDLRHESTHAILHSVLPMVPLWLDEGLAEYFEVGSAQRVSGHPHLKALCQSRLPVAVPSLARLERLVTLEQMGPDEYLQSWAWVHFMLHGSPAARAELHRFMRDIQTQRPPATLSDQLISRVPNLEAEFTAHFRRACPPRHARREQSTASSPKRDNLETPRR